MPIITITKAEYSDAPKIAERVAARLNYTCIGRRELFARAAEDFEFPEKQLVEEIDEPAKIWQQNREKQGANFNVVRASFLNLCNEHGDLIYHGYSGQVFVRRVPHALRILVIADMEYRIQEAMKLESVDRDKAVELITKHDKKVTKWNQQQHALNWQDPSKYDLVLNIGRMDTESAVEGIVQIIKAGGFNTTEASKSAFDDELLASVVWSKLTNTEQTSSAIVETLAENGRVTISGVARSNEQKTAISTVAAAIEGVKKVENEMGIGAIWRM